MLSLECDIKTCRKSVKTQYINCQNCKNKYCSKKCLQFHKLFCKDTNSIPEEFEKFSKTGEYMQILQNDPLYEYHNFELIKIGNVPQTIGNGLYGDLYMAKNIQNNKIYSIKQVY